MLQIRYLESLCVSAAFSVSAVNPSLLARYAPTGLPILTAFSINFNP
jgi:hypothetical protein